MEKLTKLKMNSFRILMKLTNPQLDWFKKTDNITTSQYQNERGDPAEITWVIRNYYKQLHADKLNNLYKIDKFFEKHHLPKLTKQGIARNILNKI